MNIKKILLGVLGGVFLLIVGVAIFVVFFANSQGDAQESTALDDGVLTVGVPYDLSSYGITWAETDIAQRVGALLGTEVVLVPVVDQNGLSASRTQRLEALNSGTIDVLLAQIGYADTFKDMYLTSQSYGTAGFYVGNPAGFYVNNFSVLDSGVLVVSDLIPAQLLYDVAGISNMTQTLQEQAFSSSTGSQTGDSQEFYLFTQEQAMILAAEGATYLHITPLQQSPSMDLVAVANLGETQLISACNQAISDYLDALTLEDVSASDDGVDTTTPES